MILTEEEKEELSRRMVALQEETIMKHVRIAIDELYKRDLTIPEVAKYLNKSRDAVYKMITRGTLKFHTVNGKKMISITDLKGQLFGEFEDSKND